MPSARTTGRSERSATGSRAGRHHRQARCKGRRPQSGQKAPASVTPEQMQTLMDAADNLRDRAIISLLFDSGLRLSEVASIRTSDIDWDSNTLRVVVKGNREAKAVFTDRTASLLREYLSSNGHSPTLFGVKAEPSRTCAHDCRQCPCQNGEPGSSHSRQYHREHRACESSQGANRHQPQANRGVKRDEVIIAPYHAVPRGGATHKIRTSGYGKPGCEQAGKGHCAANQRHERQHFGHTPPWPRCFASLTSHSLPSSSVAQKCTLR